MRHPGHRQGRLHTKRASTNERFPTYSPGSPVGLLVGGVGNSVGVFVGANEKVTAGGGVGTAVGNGVGPTEEGRRQTISPR